jgi:hypothetical protein
VTARTSNALARTANRILRPLCVSTSALTLLVVSEADQTRPTLFATVAWTTGGLFALWLLAGVGSVLTEPGDPS